MRALLLSPPAFALYAVLVLALAVWFVGPLIPLGDPRWLDPWTARLGVIAVRFTLAEPERPSPRRHRGGGRGARALQIPAEPRGAPGPHDRAAQGAAAAPHPAAALAPTAAVAFATLGGAAMRLFGDADHVFRPAPRGRSSRRRSLSSDAPVTGLREAGGARRSMSVRRTPPTPFLPITASLIRATRRLMRVATAKRALASADSVRLGGRSFTPGGVCGPGRFIRD